MYHNTTTLHWHHNEPDGVSDHQPHDCLLACLFRHGSKKTPKLSVTGLCEGNSPGTGEFPAQKASNAKKVSIRWRHHAKCITVCICVYIARHNQRCSRYLCAPGHRSQAKILCMKHKQAVAVLIMDRISTWLKTCNGGYECKRTLFCSWKILSI